MPTGPKGERRPADVIGNAVKVMRIATGEEPEDHRPRRRRERPRREGARKEGRGTGSEHDARAASRDRETRGEERGLYKRRSATTAWAQFSQPYRSAICGGRGCAGAIGPLLAPICALPSSSTALTTSACPSSSSLLAFRCWLSAASC